ncbi:MAG: flagellar basal body-associated FliL family protein [Woeseiaceae bacterium]|nr:flagellar basal body-associated FliL family protein [Woeseiaceae bacterium]
MAEETGTQEVAEEEEKGGGMMKKLLLAVAALALVGVGAFVGLMFMGGDAEAPLDEDGNPIEAEAEEPASKGDGPTFYTNLAPPLVVNFKDRLGDPHVMQVTLEVMARDQATINEVREHIPIIRNALILLYSGYIYEDVSTREGKEMMLADGLAEIQRVMTQRIGKPAIEEVYFTGLVIQ